MSNWFKKIFGCKCHCNSSGCCSCGEKCGCEEKSEGGKMGEDKEKEDKEKVEQAK